MNGWMGQRGYVIEKVKQRNFGGELGETGTTELDAPKDGVIPPPPPLLFLLLICCTNSQSIILPWSKFRPQRAPRDIVSAAAAVTGVHKEEEEEEERKRKRRLDYARAVDIMKEEWYVDSSECACLPACLPA